MATVKPDEVSQKVEVGIEKHEQWAEILNTARKVMLSTEMEEAVKWGTPPTRLREKTWSVSRHWRFEQGDKFNRRKVKAYVKEAIENQRAGKAIKPAPKENPDCAGGAGCRDEEERETEASIQCSDPRQAARICRPCGISQAGENQAVAPRKNYTYSAGWAGPQ